MLNIKSFKKIELMEMGKVKLMNRIDRKYWFHLKDIQAILDTVNEDFFVLNIDGKSILPYATTYFDTDSKPVFISDFGGGALYGHHGSKDALWTEEFQEDLYLQTTKMLERIPQLRGMTHWILADFRSPRRILPVIQDGWNRKGVLSYIGDKKKAFFVLQKYYQSKADEYKNK